MTALSMLLLGFLFGMKHATEADHLAAVATLATRQSTVGQTVRQRIAWGIGHTITLTLFGAAMLLVGTALPHAVAEGLELAVGVMLVILARSRKGGAIFRIVLPAARERVPAKS